MTAMLDRTMTPEMGSMTPRVYTPPLDHHCTGPTADRSLHPKHPLYKIPLECPCGCGLNPDTSWGFSCNRFAREVLGWKLLPWQQWLNIHALEKNDEDGGFRFPILVVLVARQNGKTHWLKAVGLWRLFISRHGDADHTCPGARLALIAAQNLSYAETVLKEVVDAVRDNHALSQELINYRVTNGNNRLILSNRRYWRAATASRKGGRSLAVDIAMLDELREHVTSDAWDAIAPTTTSRSYSQIVCTSNAGDKRSEVLRSLRDPALKRITTKETTDTNIGLFEWSVPTDVDPRVDTYWHLANPALGHLNSFKLNDLRALFEAAQYRNLPGFQTENLCMWVDAIEPGIIPAIHWAETVDKESRRKDVNTPVYAGLDVNYERSRSFIAIASRRKDGNLHIEVINGARGTDWVIPWLAERKKMFKGVAVQAIGAPATSMIEDLRKAGVPVVEWGPGKEVANGSGEFYDGICEHKIFHRPAPVLDRAAAAGVPRNVGEGWVFDRRHSLVDVSPIVACVAAAWLEHRGPKAPPMIHAWPDEDTLKQWEDTADKKFPPPPPGTPARSKLDEIDGTTTWWTQ